MILSKIWERYFLREIAKIFFLFLFSFYFLYVLIDYSVHAKHLRGEHISFYQLFIFYLCHFSKRADILIPFAFMLGCIKTLCSLNVNNELIAMFSGGIKLRRLLRPFFLAAFTCSILLYVNAEFVIPTSLAELEAFEDAHFNDKDKAKAKTKASLNEITLQDDTRIIYQGYNSSQRAFFDIYWVRSADNLYHMKYFFPHLKTPLGLYVDHVIRNKDGEFLKIESFEEKEFPDIQFNDENLQAALHPPPLQSISQLWDHLPRGKDHISDKEAQVLTYFCYKLAMPLTCLLVVFGVAPSCVRFGRHLPVFLIYALGIFCLMAYITIMDAATIIGENQVVSPFTAIYGPLGAVFLIVTWRYYRNVR